MNYSPEIDHIFTPEVRKKALNELLGALDRLKPPPKLTVSQWADTSRRLSAQSSSEPGQWNTARAEYQRGILDAFSEDETEGIVAMLASQLGKSEILLNIMGYFIEHDPCPILMLQPTVDMAQSFSKDRVSAGLIRPSPTLRNIVSEGKLKNVNNTTLHKVFPGGALSLVGANSPSSLASRPIRIVLCDEVDRYPSSAGEEGDPISLAKRRSATFWNSKWAEVSTPTNRGSSRIEKSYEASDQRKYHVPCPHCGSFQELVWARVHWRDDDPDTARYHCEHCSEPWTDTQRHASVRNGHWVATHPFRGIAGFHLNGLYSPWYLLRDAVNEFLSARRDPMRLKTFVNTFLAETFEDEGEGADSLTISDRAEDYRDLPEEAVVLTAGVDVQDDRLEVEIVAWGAGEESWSMDYKVLYGDPSGQQVWNDLDEVLDYPWPHPAGVDLTIASTCIDSGGHHTRAVYDYVKRKGHRRFAIKGVGGEGKPAVGRPTRNNIGKVPLYPVGVDTLKEIHVSRLSIEDEGPGYCHFPSSRDKEYFDQLTAERRVTTFLKGTSKRVWKKMRKRNEAMDVRIYAIAAFVIMSTPISHIVRRFHAGLDREEKKRDKPKEEKKRNPLAPQRSRAPRGGFANSWR